jgi:hypothetical protein
VLAAAWNSGRRSSPCDEGPRRGEQSRAEVGDIPLSKHPRRRAIVQLRIESLEPRLGDCTVVVTGDELGELRGEPETLLDLGMLRPSSVDPRLDGARLDHAGDVGDQLRAEACADVLHNPWKRQARRFNEGLQIQFGSRPHGEVPLPHCSNRALFRGTTASI